MHGGREVATDEDEPGTGTGKHALGKASHSGLRHFAISCGADKPEIDLFTHPDLQDCHLIGPRRSVGFLARTYHRISLPKIVALSCGTGTRQSPKTLSKGFAECNTR